MEFSWQRTIEDRALAPVPTPSLGHMPIWAVLLALVGGTVVFGYLGARTFTNRVLN